MRVHELAKQINKTSKDILAELEKSGVVLKSHMSVIPDEALARFNSSSVPAAQPAVSAAKAPAAALKKEEVKKTEAVKAPVKEEPKAAPVTAQPAAPKAEAPRVEVKEVRAAAPVAPPPVKQPYERPRVEENLPQKVQLNFPVTVGNFAQATGRKIPDVIKTLMKIGVMANVNQLLNEEIGVSLADTLGVEIEKAQDEVEALLRDSSINEKTEDLKFRPPVVTMMGHVDHGKTSLLDAIRKTSVASKEKGFITQHIGAYGVDVQGKGHVTFLDTPGHEAFTAMRARGANVTDIVVLVVAADDGIMPQTIEAIDHAREASCPIIVAINKIDLPAANLEKVMGGLQKADLTPEEWGGKTICVKVSAKTGVGIEELLDMLLLQAEVLELKANPNRPAVGTVIEGHLSKGSGPVASIIVQNGTLKVGDIIVAGPHSGRVRALRDDLGKNMKEAGPSYAAEVMGLNGVPEAGETFHVAPDEKFAKKFTEKKRLEIREKEMHSASKHMSLESVYEKISEGNFKELKLIVKADVQGSVEALRDALERLSTEMCRVHIIHGVAGGINESDVMLAAASDAIIIGFHVRADAKAKMLADREGVDLRYYGIIYEAVENVKMAMEGILSPTLSEKIDGTIEIRQVFKSSKVGTIGGAKVKKGTITRSNQIRVVRDNVVVFEGKLASLKRFKDDVREVKEGFECGVAVDGFNDLQPGDLIEAFHIEKTATKL
ncbi:MAG TPA: translation initiation factor IF-2 [Candidatus Omnitrophota bacterium]|nr:translation initiation factor IF-2 [Candidatus Omnitrophota bacterium]